MYVRFIGTKICWTLSDERFYIGEKAEATAEELKVCETGGGYVPDSVVVLAVAQ